MHAVRRALGPCPFATALPPTALLLPPAARRDALLQGGASTSGRAAAVETEQTAELDGQGLLQLQRHMMQQQDDTLVQMEKTVASTKVPALRCLPSSMLLACIRGGGSVCHTPHCSSPCITSDMLSITSPGPASGAGGCTCKHTCHGLLCMVMRAAHDLADLSQVRTSPSCRTAAHSICAFAPLLCSTSRLPSGRRWTSKHGCWTTWMTMWM